MIISILGRTPIIGIYCLQPEKRKKTKLKKSSQHIRKPVIMQNFFHLLYLYKRYSYLHYQQEEMYVNQKEKVLRRYGERRTISLAQDITYGKVLSHYNFSFSLVNTFFKMHPCIQIKCRLLCGGFFQLRSIYF